MSPEFKILAVAAFFACVLCSIFYTQVVRPVLRDGVRFKLFALRDDLRRMAINGEISASSFHYSYLEKMLCRLIDRCFWYTWGSLFEFIVRFWEVRPSAESIRFKQKSPPALKQIFQKAIRVMIDVLNVNSHGTTIAIFAVLKVAGLFGAAWKHWLKLRAQIFFETPLDGGPPVITEVEFPLPA
jgi:hypothetical protein